MANNGIIQVVHTEVDYDAGDKDAFRPQKIVFEMDDRKDADQTELGVVRIRRYPSGQGSLNLNGFGGGPMSSNDLGYNYVVTQGSIVLTMESRERYVSGSIVVSGADSADLPYPVGRDLVLNSRGTLYSYRGHAINPSIRFDAVSQKILLPQVCYGRIDYGFYTNYAIMRYTPEVYADKVAYYEVAPENYGELLAFPQNAYVGDTSSIVAFQVQPPQGISGEFELYRVVSTGVIDATGSWEKPPGWPSAGTFPPLTGEDNMIDTGGSFLEVERVHTIAYLCLGDRQRENANTGGVDSTANRVVSSQGQSGLVSRFIKQSAANRRAYVREVRYDVPWAKPYVNTPPELYYVVYRTAASGPSTTTTNAIEYKRQITVKASKPPLVAAGTVSKEKINSVVYDDQADRVNAYIRQAYEAVDWAAIRASLPLQFNADTYASLVFDTSVPQK